jgi:myo-inositol-1(or 4)-monophosphatase
MSYLETAVAIAREAGAILSDYAERNIGYEYKRPHDLITAADRASEKLVLGELRKHYPSHMILCEESGEHEGSSEYRWYVDPLDGTTNFAHGYPIYSVSIALARNDEMIAGVVFDPTRDEMFAAERSGGASLNGKRIEVSSVEKIEESLVSSGFPSWSRHQDVNVHFFHQLAMASHGVRRGGSAALDLTSVAAGRIEAFWEFGLNPWDVAAGMLIVEEAGGKVTDMRGGVTKLGKPHILATNRRVHSQMIEILGDVFRGEYRFPLPTVTSYAEN